MSQSVSQKLRLVPDDTKLQFMKWRFIAFTFSGIAILLTAILIPMRGLNLGVDFQGGFLIEIGTEAPIDLGLVRNSLSELGLGSFEVQSFGADNVAVIRAEGVEGEGLSAEQVQQETSQSVREALIATLGDVEIRRSETVGPKVSGELFRAGITALTVALAMMLIYIWVRFEWQFGVGAVLALAHDVILTIGMFVVTQLEFNLSTIAALLTIVGYSMNDTVVVYDRVREKLRKYKKMPLPELLDFALNKTLSRTILTSGTTLLALFSIFFFGGEVLRGFSFAMIWGVIIGTFSSVFVASALLLYTGLRRDFGDEDKTDEAVAAKAAP